MGAVAASGGYYVAMPADVVVASPGTITGSIGVLAGKQVLREALERIGVRRDSVSTGPYAEMFSTDRPFTDDEWQRLEEWLDRIYADFTAKAAQDRGLDVDALRSVARGRVWTGADARERGLVDGLGGLDHAVDVACARAGIVRDRSVVRPLPKSSVLDRLRPAGSSEHPGAASPSPVPALLPQALAALGLPAYGVLTAPVLWRLG
jgi:protease-4